MSHLKGQNAKLKPTKKEITEQPNMETIKQIITMTKKKMWAEIGELGLGELTVEMHLEVSFLTLSVPS